MSAHAVAFVGLGANLGDPVVTVRRALQCLAALPDTRVLRASRLYRTQPWGVLAQPDFINAVAMLDTALAPRRLLDALLAIEREYGRERESEPRWGPRVLDLDLLLHGQTMLDEPGLRLPHPYLHARAFVLLPLAEIAPETMIPGVGRVATLATGIAASGVEALG